MRDGSNPARWADYASRRGELVCEQPGRPYTTGLTEVTQRQGYSTAAG